MIDIPEQIQKTEELHHHQVQDVQDFLEDLDREAMIGEETKEEALHLQTEVL